MNTGSRKLQWTRMLCMVVSMLLVSSCVRTPPPEPAVLETRSGATGEDGRLELYSSSLDLELEVEVLDVDTGLPVDASVINFVNDGDRILLTVVDSQGRYLPTYFAMPLDKLPDSNTAQLQPASLTLLGALIGVGSVVYAGLKKLAVAYLAFSASKAAYGIITDPPHIRDLELHLGRTPGVSFTIVTTPDQVWNAITLVTAIPAIREVMVLITGPKLGGYALTAATIHGAAALGKETPVFIDKMFFGGKADWDREWEIQVSYYAQSSLGLPAFWIRDAQLASPQTYTASGRVLLGHRGLYDVTIAFTRVSGSGAVPASVVTNRNGHWNATGFETGTTYRATPVHSGYLFGPPSRDFDSATTSLDFNASRGMVFWVERLEGRTVTVNGYIDEEDPGVGDICRIRYDWGDGGGWDAGGLFATHTYASSGTYNIEVLIEGCRGEVWTFELTVDVP